MNSNPADAHPAQEDLSSQQGLDIISALGALIEAGADAVNSQQHLTDSFREALREPRVFRAVFPAKVWAAWDAD